MSSEKPTPIEMWWPSPGAFDVLQVEESEEGFIFEAPDGTECAEWLRFWNQSEEHHETFEEAFIEMLRTEINTLDTKNGETQAVPDEQSNHREQAEDDLSGSQP